MPNFDPPSDPYGDEHNCRLCDQPLTRDPYTREWYCENDNCPHPPDDETEQEEEEVEE